MAKRPASTSPYPPRFARLRAAMKAAEVGHLLVTNPLDVGYLTGFLGGESYLLVPESGRPVVIS
ncbi:MAG: aminopeptidase P family N-terminal domain-containing protein, partial [Phycisphaerales bacterium]